MSGFENFIAIMQSEMKKPTLFGWAHIFWLVIAVVGIVVICLTCRKLSDKKFRIIVLIIGLILIVLEVFKQLNFAFDPETGVWEYSWKQFPFQFCSVPMYVMLVVACLKECKFRDWLCAFLATFGLFAGLVVLFYPATVLSEIIFRFTQSMVHHVSLVLVGVLVFVSGKVKIEHKTILKAMAVFAVFVVTAFIMNIVFHATGNTSSFNMFYIGPHSDSDLPVFKQIGQMLNISSDSVHIGNFAFMLIYVLGFSIAAYIVLLVAMLIRKIAVSTGNKRKVKQQN